MTNVEHLNLQMLINHYSEVKKKFVDHLTTYLSIFPRIYSLTQTYRFTKLYVNQKLVEYISISFCTYKMMNGSNIYYCFVNDSVRHFPYISIYPYIRKPIGDIYRVVRL